MSHISKWKGRDFSVLDPKNWAFRSELAAGLGKTTPLFKRSDQEMEAEGQANITLLTLPFLILFFFLPLPLLHEH